MTDRELMQQALEALDYEAECGNDDAYHPLRAALRERLAQPEMQPCAGRNCGSTNPNLHSAECFEDYEKSTGMSSVEHAVIAGALFDFMGWLTSRKERLVLSSADEASPAVDAIRDFAKMRGLSLDDAKVQDWNTSPPAQRTWVGLTDEEIAELRRNGAHSVSDKDFRAIEAKLKEKNT